MITTDNVKRFEHSNKSHGLLRWIKNKNQLWHLQKTDFKCKDTEKLKAKGWETIHHAKANQKKARESISDKADFKKKKKRTFPEILKKGIL